MADSPHFSPRIVARWCEGAQMQGARWIRARRPLQYVEHPIQAQRSRCALSRRRSRRLVRNAGGAPGRQREEARYPRRVTFPSCTAFGRRRDRQADSFAGRGLQHPFEERPVALGIRGRLEALDDGSRQFLVVLRAAHGDLYDRGGRQIDEDVDRPGDRGVTRLRRVCRPLPGPRPP